MMVDSIYIIGMHYQKRAKWVMSVFLGCQVGHVRIPGSHYQECARWVMSVFLGRVIRSVPMGHVRVMSVFLGRIIRSVPGRLCQGHVSIPRTHYQECAR